MTKKTATMLQRAAFLLVLAPTGACAQPADQAQPAATAAGTTLPNFLKRQEKKLLAGDTNGDGKIGQAEFLAAVQGGKGNPAKRFAKMDANGDAMLDTGEIDAMLTRRFKRLDANGDGTVSADERAAARAEKAKPAGEDADS